MRNYILAGTLDAEQYSARKIIIHREALERFKADARDRARLGVDAFDTITRNSRRKK